MINVFHYICNFPFQKTKTAFKFETPFQISNRDVNSRKSIGNFFIILIIRFSLNKLLWYWHVYIAIEGDQNNTVHRLRLVNCQLFIIFLVEPTVGCCNLKGEIS